MSDGPDRRAGVRMSHGAMCSIVVFGRRPSPMEQRCSSEASLLGWTCLASDILRFRPPVVLTSRVAALRAGIPIAALDRRLGCAPTETRAWGRFAGDWPRHVGKRRTC